MSVTISLRFPAGRYHATVWGRHVNDEVPEWPPSPWRFLRALAAAWKQKLFDHPAVSAAGPSLFAKLAAAPPEFRLPSATLGHTRHYMPIRDGQREKPTGSPVLDRFVAIDRSGDAVYIQWPDEVRLTPSEREALTRLLGVLTYLGRAESWCDAALCPEDIPISPNCRPDQRADDGVLVAVPDPGSWSGWNYPASIRRPDPVWNLLAESNDVIRSGWQVPPGCRWVTYSRPLAVGPVPKAALTRQQGVKHTVARFLLDGPVLPLVTDTVRVAETFRERVLARFQWYCHRRKYGTAGKPRREVFRSEVLSGKDAAGEPLREHRHAHYLPTAGDDPQRVTHVTVYAPNGFDADEIAALASVREFQVRVGGDRSLDLRVQLVGLGQPHDFRAALFGPRRVWRSVTPFVGPAHIGRRGRNRYLLKAIRREARRWAEDHGIKAPTVEPVDDTVHLHRAYIYRRSKARDGNEGYLRPCGLFQLRFETEVTGPICLGYASHFGLGLFGPDILAEAE